MKYQKIYIKIVSSVIENSQNRLFMKMFQRKQINTSIQDEIARDILRELNSKDKCLPYVDVRFEQWEQAVALESNLYKTSLKLQEMNRNSNQ